MRVIVVFHIVVIKRIIHIFYLADRAFNGTPPAEIKE